MTFYISAIAIFILTQILNDKNPIKKYLFIALRNINLVLGIVCNYN